MIMAEINLKTKVVLRHDISSTWTRFNPVLLSGEVGIETDTGKMKCGDGISDWNTLEYMCSGLSNEEIDGIFK